MEKGYKGRKAEATERVAARSVAGTMAYLNQKEDLRDQPARARDGQLPGVVPTPHGMVASGVDLNPSRPTPVFTSKGKYLLDCVYSGRSALAARTR